MDNLREVGVNQEWESPGAPILSSELSGDITAYSWYCRCGHTDVVNFLLTNAKLDVNATDGSYNKTPLHYASL